MCLHPYPQINETLNLNLLVMGLKLLHLVIAEPCRIEPGIIYVLTLREQLSAPLVLSLDPHWRSTWLGTLGDSEYMCSVKRERERERGPIISIMDKSHMVLLRLPLSHPLIHAICSCLHRMATGACISDKKGEVTVRPAGQPLRHRARHPWHLWSHLT